MPMSMPSWNSAPSQPKPRVTVPLAGQTSDRPAPVSVCAPAGAAQINAAAQTAASRSILPTGGTLTSSEDLGAPGQRPPPEERVRALHGSVDELLDPTGAAQLIERDRAEIRRAERARRRARGRPQRRCAPRFRPRASSGLRSTDTPRRARRRRSHRRRHTHARRARRRRRRGAPRARRPSGISHGADSPAGETADGRAAAATPRTSPSSRCRAGSATAPPSPAASRRSPRSLRCARSTRRLRSR